MASSPVRKRRIRPGKPPSWLGAWLAAASLSFGCVGGPAECNNTHSCKTLRVAGHEAAAGSVVSWDGFSFAMVSGETPNPGECTARLTGSGSKESLDGSFAGGDLAWTMDIRCIRSDGESSSGLVDLGDLRTETPETHAAGWARNPGFRPFGALGKSICLDDLSDQDSFSLDFGISVGAEAPYPAMVTPGFQRSFTVNGTVTGYCEPTQRATYRVPSTLQMSVSFVVTDADFQANTDDQCGDDCPF